MAVNLFDLYAKISLDDTQFNAGIGKALASGNTLAAKIRGVFTGISNVGKTSFKAIGGAITIGTAALGGFMKTSIDSGSKFDAAMSQVKAISGATGGDFQALRDKAMDMGAKTKFSATEAAEAFNYMGMAGWKTEDMLNGIEGVMNLAAASGEDLARTSDIVTDAMTAFGLAADGSTNGVANATHFADVLAATAANSNTNVSMLGDSFKYIAPIAGSMGYSVEDTAIALGLMANNGIKATQGGTALRNIITNMAKPTANMQKAMDALGISLTDENGNMLSLVDLMKDLRSAFNSGSIETEKIKEETIQLAQQYDEGKITIDEYNKKTNELAETVFNAAGANKAQYASMLAGKYGMAGLLAIVNATDEDFEKLTQSIYNCNGAAEEMANTMLDNLSGDVTIFKSALEGLQITISDSVTPSLRNFVQFGTDSINRVKEAFTSGGWEAAINVVSQVLAQMLNQFIAFIPQIANIAVQFISTFVSNIGSNIGSITTAANQILQAFVSGFGQIMTQLMPIISQLVPTIANYFMTFKTQMFTIGLQIIGAIAEGVVNNIDEIVNSGVQIVSQLANGISNGLPRLLDMAPQMIGKLISGLTSGVSQLTNIGVNMMNSIAQGLSTSIPNLVSQVLPMIVQFTANLRQNAGKLIDAGLNLIKNLAQGIAKAIPDLVRNIPTIVSNIAGIINDNAPKILSTGIQIIWTLIKGIIQAIPTIVKNIPKIIKAIVDVFTAFNWLNLGKQIIQFLSNGIKSMVSFAGNAAKSIFDAIVNFIKNLPNNLLNIGKNAIKFLGNGIKSMFSTAKASASGIFDTIINVIKQIPGRLLELGKNAITGLVNGIKGYIHLVANITKTIWTTIINGIKALPSKALDIGKDLIKGLWNGIKNSLGWLWDKISGFAGNLIDKVKGFFGIHSPSTVFAGIGGNMAKGMGEGFGDESNSVNKSIEQNAVQSVKVVANALTSAMPKIGAESGGMLIKSMMQSISQNSSQLLNSVKAIINGLNSMLGNFQNIGKNMASGILKGFQSMSGTLEAKIRQMMQKLVAAVKQEMQIHSPSGVFADIGENMVLGLAQGWNDKYVDFDKDLSNSVAGIGFGTSNMGSNSSDTETVTEYNMQVTINLNGSDYTSQRQIAEAISVQLQNLVDRRSAAWA